VKHPLFLVVLFATVTLLGGATPAHAHLRDYLVSQGYYTATKGEFEIEFWNDFNFGKLDNADTHSSRHQIEFEYGLTPRWQWAYYEVFTWKQGQDLDRDMFKIETKYRILEAGELPVDIALYAEYKNPDGSQDSRSDEFEGKLILSKNFGPWNVTGNWIMERKINERDDWELAYTLGASYAINPRTRLSLEIKETLGDLDQAGVHRKDHKFQLVPSIAWSPSENVRILFGPAIGLTRASDDLQLKTIVEIEF